MKIFKLNCVLLAAAEVAAPQEAGKEGKQQPESGPTGLPAPAQADADTSGKGANQEDADQPDQLDPRSMDMVSSSFSSSGKSKAVGLMTEEARKRKHLEEICSVCSHQLSAQYAQIP